MPQVDYTHIPRNDSPNVRRAPGVSSAVLRDPVDRLIESSLALAADSPRTSPAAPVSSRRMPAETLPHGVNSHFRWFFLLMALLLAIVVIGLLFGGWGKLPLNQPALHPVSQKAEQSMVPDKAVTTSTGANTSKNVPADASAIAQNEQAGSGGTAAGSAAAVMISDAKPGELTGTSNHNQTSKDQEPTTAEAETQQSKPVRAATTANGQTNESQPIRPAATVEYPERKNKIDERSELKRSFRDGWWND